ncbi:peptidoglycan bridge formation glycyltransferase FemA/FemB family protein [Candidatus Woesebacteria bacterium]|nr:peptidoglycan bridge formation glycyltransferase FemA/FemB family protein [Candidatus Woesebacteria bacterium]
MSISEEWNKQVDHPLQSYEWGEFRELTGVKVVREAGVQITIHKIPHTQFSVGYLPKGPMPTAEQVAILTKVAKEYNCIFIKVEPKIEAVPQSHSDTVTQLKKLGFVEGRSLFTKYNFVLDVTPSIEELSAAFKQKTRYNIKVAEKRGVTVEIDNSEAAFERYLQLTEETTKRQGFYAHSREYHKKMWNVLHPAGIAQLLVAKYGGNLPAGRQVITTWVLFKFNDTLYYPYGASTREHREVMANNLVMFTAIKLAKEWGLKYLDMWGALGPEPDTKDPWYGFHTFKSGYGARHVEYIGTWDYVAKPWLYKCYRAGESLRWWFLRLRKK